MAEKVTAIYWRFEYDLIGKYAEMQLIIVMQHDAVQLMSVFGRGFEGIDAPNGLHTFHEKTN